MEELLKAIDAATSPDMMNKVEAADFMEELIDQLQSRLDALQDELDEEG